MNYENSVAENPIMAGLSAKTMKKPGKPGFDRTLKMLIRYDSNGFMIPIAQYNIPSMHTMVLRNYRIT